MRDVFSRGSVVALVKRMKWIAPSIHIVEEFTQYAAPGFSAGQRVVEDQTEARNVGLQMDGERIIAGTVIRAEDGDVRHVGLLCRDILRKLRREQRVTGLVLVA